MANWTSNTQGSTTFNAVAYGNGYWVAVGVNGLLYYSTTGVGAWTSNTQGSITFNSVAYGNGYWVAVGNSGTVYYKATDPTGAWTSNTQGSTNYFGVRYGGGNWVAVGATGTIRTRATDPTGAFASQSLGSTGQLNEVDYDGTYWFVGGNAGSTHINAYATDPAATWTFNDIGTSTWADVRFFNGYWVMVGSGFQQMRYRTTDPTGAFTQNTNNNGGFTSIIYDGTNWVVVATSVSNNIRYFTGAGPTGAFTSIQNTGVDLNGVAHDGATTWVAVGASGAMYYALGDVENNGPPAPSNAPEKLRIVSSPQRW